MSRKAEAKPTVIKMADWDSGPDRLVPGCTISKIKNVEDWGMFGLYFMPPGTQTNVFSMEYEDDGTAEEYYGPCHEFYFVLQGEFTMYWGKDAEKVRAGESEKVVLKAGDFGYWPPGWKYSVKNTGKIPGVFFWGLSSPPKGIKRREYL